MKKLKIGLAGRRSVSAGKAALLQECNTKRRGELAELAFAHKASALGFKVAKPYGTSERYDFVVDSGRSCGEYR